MEHEEYMRQALELARLAMAEGEVPVGCVIVRDGAVVGRGRNRRETAQTALGHAELEAIAQACRTLGGWRLARMRPLRHPGALPHVRRGHRQRPHPCRILRGEG